MAANQNENTPNIVHPEKPSALGSRNSVNRNNRDEYFESQLIIDEEVDKILNHIENKLPPEVLSKLHVAGNIKEILHTYINQQYQNMFNRYITSVEDELAKKFRSLINKEEHRALNKFTHRELGELLENIAGVEMFNTAEVEKSVINIYGHAHGNISRGVHELEQETNSILRQKMDVGALLRGQNSYALVKCTFANNLQKPEYVHDTRIPDIPLSGCPEKIIKDLVSQRIQELIDKEVENLSRALLDEGRQEMTHNEKIFEKFKYLDEYLSEEKGDDSAKYNMVAKSIYETIKGIGAEIDQDELDVLKLRESIQGILDSESIRNRGYNTAVNMITSILDSSKMGYQHVENFKNRRKLSLREYNLQNPIDLPDEYYFLNLEYLDDNQLKQMRIGYDQQMVEFTNELDNISKVLDYVYQEEFKTKESHIDFNDIKAEYKKSYKHLFADAEDEGEAGEEQENAWDELAFVRPPRTAVEQENYNYDGDYERMVSQLNRFEKKVNKIYGKNYSDHRIILEKRISYIRNSILEFKRKINPYHCQPGLMLEIAFSTIKRKNITMKNMSNVLNEFLHNISSGFQDMAFAHFHRRRSTDTTNIKDADLNPNAERSTVSGDENVEGATINYFEFSNRSLYNNSLRHFRIVTNIVKQLGGGYNAADLINQTRENFDLTDPQILSIINVLLADKYGYSYLSVDIRQPGVQPENFYSIINKCGTFDIIVVYHHPQTGVCVLNHNNKVAWAAVSEFRAGDYLVVYTKAQSVEDKSQEKLLLTSLQDVLTGNAGDIDETFAVKFKKPQAYSTEPVKVPATKTASSPETPVSGIQQTTSSDKEDHAGETNAVPEITGN
ncbi:hypothetical protein CHS0354_027396 [Potamilus streckersoni]|uniref:Uncharacterized protein n=1 Tax=Potamilus streckersoni TaxID=2493646 RepID=A0AAE0SQU4_9BIVA|nr:hypothetical protein CHS0354_027396 [Potamilus streckersoni]